MNLHNFSSIPEYEKFLNDNNVKIKALVKICKENKTSLINEIENAEFTWFTINNSQSVSDIPNNYFDIILWSDCDIESELKVITNIIKKLKPNGRFYFNNLLTDFDKILKKCITPNEIKKLFGKENALEAVNYSNIVKNILEQILKRGDNYDINLISRKNKEFIVFVKKNSFKIVADLFLTGKDIPQTREFIEISNSIENVNEIIDELIINEIYELDEILNELSDIIDLDITDKDSWNEYIDAYLQKSVKEYSVDSEESYPIVKENMLNPILLPGIKNIGGYSCFMDSILFTILLPTIGYFSDNLLNKKLTIKNVDSCNSFSDNKENGLKYLQNFQNELKKLALIIRGNEKPGISCYPIVKEMKKCGQLANELMSGDQQDDSEFLGALMDMFDLKPTIVKMTRRKSTDKENWIETVKSEKIPFIEIKIPQDEEITDIVEYYQSVNITNFQNVDIKEWTRDDNDKRYQYLSEKYTIEDSEMLIFHISRLIFDTNANKLVNNNKSIGFKNIIQNKENNQYYELYIITIHIGSALGGHYTAYFKYGAQWFYYDDLESPKERVKIVTLETVMKNAQINGSLFFYRKINKIIPNESSKIQTIEKVIPNKMQTLLKTKKSALLFYPDFYPLTPALKNSLETIPLNHKPEICIYGKICHQQRNVGFYSDGKVGYKYSGQTTNIFPLSPQPELVSILNKVNKELELDFNGILINEYVDGSNTISAHSDDEKDLATLDKVIDHGDYKLWGSVVASLAYGAVRKFRIRDKNTKKVILDFKHLPGGLLLMVGDFQKEFTHEIPKESTIKEGRFSLTFRKHIE